MRYLVTGGAGFVGSALCRLLKETYPNDSIVAFDNLKRRGSELNVAQFKPLGIDFVHGDVRCAADLADLDGQFDVMIEASAEPSVHAGTGGTSPEYLLQTNLQGTLNCLEFARKRCGGMVFLSTSRVYSIPALRGIKLEEKQTRFELPAQADYPGLTAQGMSENFPILGHGFRSLYGSTKLASELFVEEYAANFGFSAVVNRCGVLAGAGQFGKTDQGVFTLWVARHVFGGALSYTGFGGTGKQVRDILHPRDLFALIQKQIPMLKDLRGDVFAVGGGMAGSVSLFEYTKLCEKAAGRSITILSKPKTADVDIPFLVMDSTRAQQKFSWRPEFSPEKIVQDIHGWLVKNQEMLKPLFT